MSVYIMSGQELLPQQFWVLTNAHWYTSATDFRTLATPCSQKKKSQNNMQDNYAKPTT
jgi:hypothetical protein